MFSCTMLHQPLGLHRFTNSIADLPSKVYQILIDLNSCLSSWWSTVKIWAQLKVAAFRWENPAFMSPWIPKCNLQPLVSELPMRMLKLRLALWLDQSPSKPEVEKTAALQQKSEPTTSTSKLRRRNNMKQWDLTCATEKMPRSSVKINRRSVPNFFRTTNKDAAPNPALKANGKCVLTRYSWAF